MQEKPTKSTKAGASPNRPPPPWLGRALAIAQHQDRISSYVWWKRWLHRRFISKRCPCCIAWREDQAEARRKMWR
jgi:hypothetical protein